MNITTDKSYVVHLRAGGQLIVKPSHFAVGYTPAYCATPEEALQYAINSRRAEAQKLLDDANKLEKMLSDWK